MAGIGSVLDIARQALAANSEGLRVASENIANVNTPGYSRRRAEFVTTQAQGPTGARLGTGVSVSFVQRIIDKFLDASHRSSIGDRAEAEARADYLSSVETYFGLSRGTGRIDQSLSAFFSRLQDLQNNPADPALRSQVIQSGQTLTDDIQRTFNGLANLQRQADSQIGNYVTQVNNLSAQIAEANRLLQGTELGQQQNNGVRDQREELIRQLSELVAVNTVEDSSGQISVFMANGFALVSGQDVRTLEFVASPVTVPVVAYPTGLDGGALGHIVYDADTGAGQSHVDFTSTFASGSGRISGLLQVRGVQSTTDTTSFDAVGDIPEIAARVELIARDLLVRFNNTYRGPDENGLTVALDPSSGGLDDVGAAYTPTAIFGLFTYGGATNSTAPGSASLVGTGIYANSVSFAVTDQRQLATALDLDPATGTLSFAPGDASNVTALLGLRTQTQTYTLGSVTVSGTIEDLFADARNVVANRASAAKQQETLTKDREEQAKTLAQSVSGVNLDEELIKLINFQRSFQGAARLVTVSDQMMDELMNLIR
jgi:flagellar hook-associated protein 1 FlgK